MKTYIVKIDEEQFEIDRYDKEHIGELKERVKLGNEKLGKAWQQLKEMVHNTEEWAEQMEEWHKANKKLSLYCDQLKALGFEDCLYLVDGKKTKQCLGDQLGCLVCPSLISYWEREMDALPSAGTQKEMAV